MTTTKPTPAELRGKQDSKTMEAFIESRTWNIHPLRDQKEIVELLYREGIRAVGIGSVATKGLSSHDIDILILDSFSPETLFRVERTLGEAQAWSDTDWGGYFYLQTKFGNVDVFFLDRLMNRAEASPSSGLAEAVEALDDNLGQVVREAWVTWAEKQPDPKPSWLKSWGEISDAEREADRQIGVAVGKFMLAILQVPSEQGAAAKESE